MAIFLACFTSLLAQIATCSAGVSKQDSSKTASSTDIELQTLKKFRLHNFSTILHGFARKARVCDVTVHDHRGGTQGHLRNFGSALICRLRQFIRQLPVSFLLFSVLVPSSESSTAPLHELHAIFWTEAVVFYGQHDGSDR